MELNDLRKTVERKKLERVTLEMEIKELQSVIKKIEASKTWWAFVTPSATDPTVWNTALHRRSRDGRTLAEEVAVDGDYPHMPYAMSVSKIYARIRTKQANGQRG
jgi:hypothetical protein